MTNRSSPASLNDLQDVIARNRIARQLARELGATQELAAHLPGDVWQHLARAFADVPALAAEIKQLRAALTGARLDRADLAVAAIAAHDDGEPDPLSYLRDELRAQGYNPVRGRR